MNEELNFYMHFFKWVMGTFFVAGFGSMTVGEFIYIPFFVGLVFTISSIPLGIWLGILRDGSSLK